MNISFICYWGINDGLTVSTVIPHLDILSRASEIKEIHFYTIERTGKWRKHGLPTNVIHHPLISGRNYFDKISDFIKFPLKLSRDVQRYKIALMMCRGTPAGALGYLVHKKMRVPYVVESFEPHAMYMVESGVWKRSGLRFLFQRFLERKQMETASYLLPVANAMRTSLISQKINPDRIEVMPCAVDEKKFVFDRGDRIAIRNKLSVSDDTVVAIYVGKFGGLYYNQEAYEVFGQALRYFVRFHLIILTPDDQGLVSEGLSKEGYQPHQFHVCNVLHEEVSAYLSAADFAFALYKPSPSKRFLSPIKIGEYWSLGLPVMIPEGIGDDSEIIEASDAGAVFQLESLSKAFKKIGDLIGKDRFELRQRIRALALKNRSFDVNAFVYRKIIAGMVASKHGYKQAQNPINPL